MQCSHLLRYLVYTWVVWAVLIFGILDGMQRASPLESHTQALSPAPFDAGNLFLDADGCLSLPCTPPEYV